MLLLPFGCEQPVIAQAVCMQAAHIWKVALGAAQLQKNGICCRRSEAYLASDVIIRQTSAANIPLEADVCAGGGDDGIVPSQCRPRCEFAASRFALSECRPSRSRIHSAVQLCLFRMVKSGQRVSTSSGGWSRPRNIRQG